VVATGISGGTSSFFFPPGAPVTLVFAVLALIAEAGGGPVGIIPKPSFPAAIAAKLVEVTGLVLLVITGPV
jgi:hypothetical protein